MSQEHYDDRSCARPLLGLAKSSGEGPLTKALPYSTLNVSYLYNVGAHKGDRHVTW